MLSAGLEASCVSTYADDLMDCLDGFPGRVQPHVSAIRSLDWDYAQLLASLRGLHEELKAELEKAEDEDSIGRRRSLVASMKRLLYAGQINGEEKLAQLASIAEAADAKLGQLDNDARHFEPQTKAERSGKISIIGARPGRNGGPKTPTDDAETLRSVPCRKGRSVFCRTYKLERCPSVRSTDGESTSGKGPKRPRRQKQFPDYVRDVEGVKKERSAELEDAALGPAPSPAPPKKPKAAKKPAWPGPSRKRSGGAPKAATPKLAAAAPNPAHAVPVDPDEKIYCLCQQISFGEMIGCDHDGCTIEWFHFNCVQLSSKPKGKWFCPNCRGDRPNVIKASLK